LQVFTECPIFIVRSERADCELSSPFTYLCRVVESNGSSEMMSKCSTWISLGACRKNGTSWSRSYLRENGSQHSLKAASSAATRSSPENSVSSPSKEFESPLVVPPINDIETFLAGLRFEKRNLLAELPSDLLEDRLN